MVARTNILDIAQRFLRLVAQLLSLFREWDLSPKKKETSFHLPASLFN